MRFLANALVGKIARLGADVRGMSAVEFALILPIMILLFVGGNQWTEAITIKRKITLVSRTLGDLVAQDSNNSVTNAEMTSIFGAAAALAAPFPTTTLVSIVSRVDIDANGNAKVIWSDSSPTGSAIAANTPVTLPWTASDLKNNMNMAGTSLIWSQTSYSYTPPVAFTMWSSTNTGAITLSDQSFFSPRTGSTIARVP